MLPTISSSLKFLLLAVIFNFLSVSASSSSCVKFFSFSSYILFDLLFFTHFSPFFLSSSSLLAISSIVVSYTLHFTIGIPFGTVFSWLWCTLMSWSEVENAPSVPGISFCHSQRIYIYENCFTHWLMIWGGKSILWKIPSVQNILIIFIFQNSTLKNNHLISSLRTLSPEVLPASGSPFSHCHPDHLMRSTYVLLRFMSSETSSLPVREVISRKRRLVMEIFHKGSGPSLLFFASLSYPVQFSLLEAKASLWFTPVCPLVSQSVTLREAFP